MKQGEIIHNTSFCFSFFPKIERKEENKIWNWTELKLIIRLRKYKTVFADFKFPPCEIVDEKTYATVQVGKDLHMSLNSDLMYINHSCEPTLVRRKKWLFCCSSFFKSRFRLLLFYFVFFTWIFLFPIVLFFFFFSEMILLTYDILFFLFEW